MDRAYRVFHGSWGGSSEFASFAMVAIRAAVESTVDSSWAASFRRDSRGCGAFRGAGAAAIRGDGRFRIRRLSGAARA